jgi:opacity protein-like surface antigen
MGVIVKTVLALAGATALANTAAMAADFPPAMPPQMQYQQAPVDTGGWYLRGDIGVGKQNFTTFDHFQTNSAFVWPASWRIDQINMGDAVFAGFGVGYAWNSFLRVDVTGEFRAKSSVKALGSYTEFCPGGRCFDLNEGSHSAWVFLANAYLDLGTWWCITPFIGAGIGTAYTKSTGFTDVGFISDGSTGFGFADKEFNKWNMAWALHAGLAYNVTNNFKMELAYRYLNMGDVQTSVINCSSGGCANANGARAFYTLTDFNSHDIKLGMRWMLQPEAPQPVYSPPPLMRRG